MKKVIFLSVNFFGYEESIRNVISENGYECELIYSEPKYSVFDSVIKKLNKKWYIKKSEKYIYKKINDIDICDYLIINFSPNLSIKSLEDFRLKFPNAKIIYYIWDSVANFPNVLNIAKCCDKVYSFDRNDCEKYGYNFLPLFYSKTYKKENIFKEYDYSMIFSIYPKKIFNYKLLNNAIPLDKRFFKYIYVPRKMFYYYKFFFPEFKIIKKSDVKFKPLDRQAVYEKFRSSKVTIDCPLENQCGLTMRTFEALSLGIKIITTNSDIMNYEFYNSNNIYIVKNDKDKIPNDFFELPFDYSFSMENYSINNFVKKLLEGLN